MTRSTRKMGFVVSLGSIGYLDQRNPPVSASGRQKSIRGSTYFVGEASMVGFVEHKPLSSWLVVKPGMHV